MRVKRFWIQESLLVSEDLNKELAAQYGMVCVVKVDEVVQMLASLGDGAWRQHVSDPLPQPWEPPLSPCDPIPTVPPPYKGPCDPPPEQWEPPIKVVS